MQNARYIRQATRMLMFYMKLTFAINLPHSLQGQILSIRFCIIASISCELLCQLKKHKVKTNMPGFKI